MTENVCAIILAAGLSSRMGQIKQLLPIGEHCMLAHVIDRVLEERFTKVIAVIGHEAAAIQEQIHVVDSRFQWVINQDYRLGQSSSLTVGIQQLTPADSNVMIFLGDLPFISKQTIQAIYESGTRMVHEQLEPFMIRPLYKEIPGHPVFLGRIEESLFAGMYGDQGARSIFKRLAVKKCLAVKDEGAAIDIDTPQDYKEAKKQAIKLNILNK